MQVLLQKDVKDLGKVGDIVNVKDGFARNFLFPQRLAVKSSEKNAKEYAHLKKVAEIKSKKAVGERKELADKVNGQTVSFEMTAGDTDKLFGSVSSVDVSKKLGAMGFSIDKKDISMDIIKMLGQHKAAINFGDDITAEIVVSIEKK